MITDEQKSLAIDRLTWEYLDIMEEKAQSSDDRRRELNKRQEEILSNIAELQA